MALRELLVRVASDYPGYRSDGRVDSRAPTYRLVHQEIPNALRALAGDRRPYVVQGSTGAGNVTPAPWIAVFDPAVTDTAQRGYYVVYLFSIDLERVYACLALGVTAFEETYGKNQRMLGRLDAVASSLANRLALPVRFSVGNINLAAAKPTQLHGLYEHSVITSVEYQLADLPEDSVLREDLLTLLEQYDRLRREVGPHVDEETAVEEVEVEHGGLMEEVPFAPVPTSRGSSSSQDQRRSRASKKIGDAGEKRVRDHERERLARLGRPDLAKNVRWVADDGEQPGYDVLSFNDDGSERWIEVKTSKGDKVNTVDLTERERLTAMEAPEGRYWLYVVTRVFRGARVMKIEDPARTLTWGPDNPRPISWTLRLR